MKTSISSIILAVTFVSISGVHNNSVAADDGVKQRIETALNAPDRLVGDKAQDEGRQSVEVMEYFGVSAGMTVVDLVAGSGYNTEILSAAVGTEGKVYSQNVERTLNMRDGAPRRDMEARLANSRLANTVMWLHDITALELDGKIDFAILSMNLHDFYIFGGEEGAIANLQAIKKSLKPGGVLGVIDHVGIAGADNKQLHRIELAIAEDLLKKAGFTIEAKSDLLANPEDDHTKNVFDASLRGNTDRFMIKAVN